MLSLLNDMSKRLRSALLFIFLFSSFHIFHSGFPYVFGADAGKEAPDFTLNDLGGKSYSLSTLKGKGVIHLIFTAVWCAPCKGEMAKLNDAYERLQPEGYIVLAIGVQTRQTPERLKEFMQKENIMFPVLYDASGKIVESYDAQLPTSIIIDRKGIIRHVWTFVPAGFDEVIEKLLKE
jgi:peroxiredoxin